MNLSRKLILTIGSLVMVSSLAIAILSSYLLTSQLKERVHAQLSDNASRVHDTLNVLIESRQTVLLRMAKSKSLRLVDTSGEEGVRGEIEDVLLVAASLFEELVVTDKNDRPIAHVKHGAIAVQTTASLRVEQTDSLPHKSVQSYLACEGKKGLASCDLIMATTISNAYEEHSGHLLARVSSARLSAAMNRLKVDPEFSIHLLDSSGSYMTHTNPKYINRSALPVSELAAPREHHAHERQRHAAMAIKSPISGVASLSTILPVKRWNWWVLTTMPQKIFDASTRKIQLIIYAVIAVSAILALLAAIFIARSLTTPLRRLVVATKRIGEGNFRESVAVHSKDEIGELGQAFNRMGAALEDVTVSRDELQEEIEQRKVLEDALRASEQQSRQVIETASDAFISMDQFGKVARWNKSAEELFGWDQEEALGRRVSELIMPTKFRSLHERGFPLFVNRFRGQAVERRMTTIGQDRHGAEFPVEVTISTIGEGDHWQMNAFIQNISSRQKAEEERLARERHETASLAKSNLLAEISHEIRTPLNCIIGFTEGIQTCEVAPVVQNQAAMILHESDFLMNLVNGLLDDARIEAGKATLDNAPADIPQLCENVMSLFSLIAERKQLDLKVTIAENVPSYLMLDEYKVQQVLKNLLFNSMKFVTRGYVRLDVERVDVSGENSMIRFAVNDTGPGIAAERLKTLFSPFERGDTSDAGHAGSVGLGTTISKRIVGLLGGEINVTSELGFGSCFSFTVPLIDVPPNVLDRITTAARRAPSGRFLVDQAMDCSDAKVLLAEDYAPNREVVRNHLAVLGCQIVMAEDGVEAVAACAQQSFDLVLMDIQMPNLDGHGATRAIRAGSKAGATVPIVALTADARADTVERCLDAGMDKFFAKPIRRASFLELVQGLLVAAGKAKPRKQAQQDSLPEKDATPELDSQSGNPSSSRFDYRAALEEFGGKPKLLQSMLQHFVKTLRTQLPQMSAALAAKDLASLIKEAHKIRGAASNLLARDLATLAERLEVQATTGNLSDCTTTFAALEVEANALDSEIREFL